MGQNVRKRPLSPNMKAVWEFISQAFEPDDKFDGHKVWDVASEKGYFLNVDRAYVSHALGGLWRRDKLVCHGWAVFGLKPKKEK